MRRNPRVWYTTGVGAGHGMKPRWMDADDALVRAHYPDIKLLLELLPDRTKPAIKARAAKLGLTAPPPTAWTAKECSALRRKRGEGLTVRELLPFFPGRTYRAIEDQLRESQIFAGHRMATAKDPLVEAIRQRARHVGMSISELGRRSKAPQYFNRTSSPRIMRHIAAAVAVLGGELDVEWEPLD